MGKPQHVALVWNGTDPPTLFVDGRPAPASTGRASKIVGKPYLLFGDNLAKEGWRFESFAGILDEVRISKGVRYANSFTPRRPFTSDNDTLALYHFDEGEGDVLHDSSGNNHHGKISGAKWVKADGSLSPPAVDYALKFSGEDSIAFDQIVDYKPDSFTIEAYVRPDAVDANGVMATGRT